MISQSSNQTLSTASSTPRSGSAPADSRQIAGAHLDPVRGPTDTRTRGVVNSRRPVMTPEKRERMAQRARKAQAAAGTEVAGSERTNARANDGSLIEGVRTIGQWLTRVGAAAYEALPALPELPGPGLPGAGAAELPSAALGTGGVVTITYNFVQPEIDPDLFISTYREILSPEFQREDVPRKWAAQINPLNPGDADSAEIRDALRQFLGRGKVHTVEALAYCNYPYPRNLAIQGPRGMLLNSFQDQFRTECSRLALTRFFEKQGIPCTRSPAGQVINFSNVQWIPDLDMLVAADMDAASFAWLVEAFDEPIHKLYVNLNHMTKTPSGRTLCYDLDIGFLAVPTEHGDWVVLIHDPCIEDWRLELDGQTWSSPQTSTPLSNVLSQVGLKVIRLSEADTLHLTANALPAHDGSGRLLMSDKNLSESLRSQLRNAGVTPVSIGGKLLGHDGTSVDHFGIHCLTLHIPAPQPRQHPVDPAAAPNELEKTDL